MKSVPQTMALRALAVYLSCGQMVFAQSDANDITASELFADVCLGTLSAETASRSLDRKLAAKRLLDAGFVQTAPFFFRNDGHALIAYLGDPPDGKGDHCIIATNLVEAVELELAGRENFRSAFSPTEIFESPSEEVDEPTIYIVDSNDVTASFHVKRMDQGYNALILSVLVPLTGNVPWDLQ